MASSYTTRIGLEKQGDGENANTWGLKLNSNVIDLVDEAIAGYETIDLSSGSITLTSGDGVSNQARNFGLKLTGALPANTTVTIPAKEKIYYIFNNTTEDHTIFLKPAGGTAVSVVQSGRSMIAAVDSSNINLLESVDPTIFTTKIETQALSATLETRIAGVSSTFAATSATLETRIAGVSSTFAATSATLNTRITNTSAALETRIATTSATLNTRITNNSFPSGTRMIFQQTAAPLGWTKDTSHNDKALRITSGTVSTGGSVAFETAFASQTPAGSLSISTPTVSGTVGGTALTEAQLPSHRHFMFTPNIKSNVSDPDADANNQVSRARGAGGDPGSDFKYSMGADSAAATIGRSATTGSGSTHTHSWSGTVSSISGAFTGNAIDLDVQYVDVIICTKD